VAAKAGDGDRAGELLRRMAVICEQAGTLEQETATLRSVAAAPAPELSAHLTRELPAVETSLRERFITFYLDLGAFVEAARVAGLAGKRGLLDERSGRRYLEWVLTQKEEELAPEVRHELDVLNGAATTPGDQAQAADSALRDLAR
jgi:hypothetical protein